MNQDLVFLTDGGDNLHALVDGFSPCTEHYLDWFHVTMPLTVLVDREGVVRYVAEGYKPGHEKRYAEQLRELLNE